MVVGNQGGGNSEYTDENDMVRLPLDIVVREYCNPKKAIVDIYYVLGIHGQMLHTLICLVNMKINSISRKGKY